MHCISMDKLNELKKEKEENELLMDNLVSRLDGERCVAGIKKKELATQWGVSPSIVTDVFKRRTQMSFSYLTKTNDLLKKSDTSKLNDISNYIRSAKLENLQETMEYLSLRGDFSILDKVINKVKEKGNIEWAEIYLLIAERYTEEINFMEFYKKIKEKEKQVKSPEMNILIELILCQAMYQCGNYSMLSEQLKDLKLNINNITNRFIKKTYKIRLHDAIAVITLQQGELKKSRKACTEVLKACETDSMYKIAEVTALGKLGESYIFEDYYVSKAYLESAISKIDLIPCCYGLDKKKEQIMDTMNFLKIYHWKEIDEVEDQLSGMELAYYLVKKGNNKGAENVLLDLKKKNGRLSDLQTYVLALARDSDKDLLKQSLKMCEENGNIFYSFLPKKKLGFI
ncbi:TPA: hypothetical protein QCZ00_003947 [Bacillus cereus]|nr:hypothetical protein [Bacillus cereus]